MDEDTRRHTDEDPEDREAGASEPHAAWRRDEAADAVDTDTAEFREQTEEVQSSFRRAERSAAAAADEAERLRVEAREARTELDAAAGATANEFARVPRERIVATEEAPVVPESRAISFGDGFRFGCGFTTASCLFWIVVLVLLALIPIVLSALNVLDFG